MCDFYLKVTEESALTLKTLASIAYGKHLWLKNKSPTDYHPCSRDFSRMWDPFPVTKELVGKVMKKNLPHDLTIHLIEVMKTIGNRLFEWKTYATKTLGISYEGYVIPYSGYPDFLSWTPYGTIDEASMFEYYQDLGYEFSKYHRFGLNELGCSIASREYMKGYAHELRATMKECFKFNFSFKHYRHYALIASSLLYVEKAGALNEQLKSRYNPNGKSKAVLMFSLCAKDGYYIALKYYWGKMTRKEQRMNLLPAAVEAIQMKPTKNDKTDTEGQFDFEKYNFILAFLIDKMTDAERRQFLVDYELGSKMLIILATSWPWQDYFLPLFREIENSLKVEHLLEILIGLGKLMVKDNALEYNIQDSIYYKFFKIVLIKLNEKANYFENCTSKSDKKDLINKFKEMLSPLYDLMLITLLRNILNDKKLSKYREDFLNCGKKNILALLENNNFKKLEKFANKVLQTDKERKKFKMSLNIWEDLILNDKYQEVDKLIAWQGETPDDQSVIKNQINAVKICEELFSKNNFVAIEKFLAWKCETPAEKSKIMDHFKTDEFLCNKFYEIWSSINSEHAEIDCNKFLMIMLQTENNMTKFIKEKIYNDQLVETFCDKLCSTKNFKNFKLIKKLLQFCRITQKQYNDLKLSLGNNINHWIKKYAHDNDCFELADELLKFVFQKDKRKEVIKTFLMSHDGLSLCEMMFEKHYGSNSAFVLFTSTWVKPCGPEVVKQIKEHVTDSLEEEMSEDHLSCIGSALDCLIKGKNISDYDLTYIEEDKRERRREKKNRARGFGDCGGWDSDSSNEDEDEYDEDSEDDYPGRNCSIS